MTPIDQNRLLQMRSAILSQNQALQRAAGLDAPQPATDATSFTQTLSDAVRAVDQQQAILLPAFVTSELKTAFQIGFLIFLPFLIIDLMVASALMSLGMMMLSPTIVSMPFKLLLFVLVDGWALTMGSLAASFGGE